MDLEKIGTRIASLRKERKLTGEALAERLQVSPQAVSKWENGRCLPETAILPVLAEALGCSIDSLLCPGEFLVLEAVYTDGQTQIPVTAFVNGLVRDNGLNILVKEQFLRGSLPGGRLKVLTIKYQTPAGIFYSYALQDSGLVLDRESACFPDGQSFQVIGAYYGNEEAFSSAMQKMKHYAYFKWDSIPVNHETFPSSTASDDTEYLTLIYLNEAGIHVISCPEQERIYYGPHRTSLYLADHTKCILKGIGRLSWGEERDCSWAGALEEALRYMGESYSYSQIMGMSGACFRVCFTDVWDYSCTDALVAYDYATPLFENLGYTFRMVDRLEKQERKIERLAIMEDIRKGKPVLAINLRVAPEWGILTGYTENGNRFLCRTYFDQEVFDRLDQEEHFQEDRRLVFEENEGYLYNDSWPFLLIHFEEKKADPVSGMDALRTSLSTLYTSFYGEAVGGYYQGKEAYQAWIQGLAKESDFQLDADRENVLRRLCVNDSMLCSLKDARQAAASYLQETAALVPDAIRGHVEEMAVCCRQIADMVSGFREQCSRNASSPVVYHMADAYGAATPGLRREQIALLEQALLLDETSCRLAGTILEMG